jgi:hypothetical protein
VQRRKGSASGSDGLYGPSTAEKLDVEHQPTKHHLETDAWIVTVSLSGSPGSARTVFRT